jgi:molybdopterin-containing oxidoreductase family iron-sulfur binding subunit
MKTRIDLGAIRNRLAHEHGPQYWRSLDELAESEAFQEFLKNEFPAQAPGLDDLPSRRKFIALMGASLALAGLSACSSTAPAKIVPYVREPEDVISGKPMFFATAMPLAGYGIGLIATSNMGRPTKVDGNPMHPASMGASDVFSQASVLDLYDPDRAQAITLSGNISTWSTFLTALSSDLDAARADRGARIRILTETVTSPTLAGQLEQWIQLYPQAKWISYEPTGEDNAREGSRLAFGSFLDTQYFMDRADVILSLDGDFLSVGPGRIRYTRDFSRRRKPQNTQGPQSSMNRLYVAESSISITGAMADHRFPVRSSEIESVARAIAQRCGVRGTVRPEDNERLPQWPWLEALVRDLQSHRQTSLVLAGSGQSATVHACAHAINDQLGNFGNTVVATDPVEANPGIHLDSFHELVDEMKSGRVDLLIIVGGNPIYTAPADFEFEKALEHVRTRVHLSTHEDETSERCQWNIPETHYLESWGDVRAYDGTASIIQPLINPLYDGKSAIELLSTILGQSQQSGYDSVRAHWQQQLGGPDFESAWRQAVHDGVIAGTAAPVRDVHLTSGFQLPEVPSPLAPDSKPDAQQSLEIVFRSDPTIFDGRFANNGWLQELPKPLTRLTWDSAALISPATAERLHLANEDMVEIRHESRSLWAPVWITPGHALDSITIQIGYGRTRSGKVGTGLGFNSNVIRTSLSPWIIPAAKVLKIGTRYPLASTQLHQNMEDRENIRTNTAENYARNPRFIPETEREAQETFSLYPQYPPSEYAWGMSIDLASCVGCNACVVACQSENNIPIVGKTEVVRGRQMHWIRVDTYYRGGLENPDAFFQPVPCMHCENAPCEIVCPVGATTHSTEGLNEMTYNRCVGTRYCSNNCPYKVRRFNFFEYSDFQSSEIKLLANPDVSVRSRGVMEKCTYCVQRIQRARIDAEEGDRKIRDGDIVTACQAACPAEAIVFGDIHDSESRVSKLKSEPRSYGLLAELNTRPRTTYLAKLTNPNPEIAKGTS